MSASEILAFLQDSEVAALVNDLGLEIYSGEPLMQN